MKYEDIERNKEEKEPRKVRMLLYYINIHALHIYYVNLL